VRRDCLDYAAFLNFSFQVMDMSFVTALANIGGVGLIKLNRGLIWQGNGM